MNTLIADTPLNIIGALIVTFGCLFLFLGSLGLLRMPDLFNRIQAGAKTTTLGTILVLGGTAILFPEWWVTLVLVGFFLLFTNPVSSNVLANIAHRQGTAMTAQTVTDQLAAAEQLRDQQTESVMQESK